MTYWFAGQLCQGSDISLALNEPAFLYGATVFTTLRIYGDSLDHPLTQWLAHQARLAQALTDFGWSAPDWTQVRQGIASLLPDYPVLRITCFPDGRELVTGRSLPTDLTQMQTEGIAAWVAQGGMYQRPMPAYKTGNYLSTWLALQAARSYGAREAILVDAQGQWLETSTGNLWGWANSHWHTPPLEAELLPGIARLHILDYLEQRGDRVSHTPWSPGAIPQFEALAYSNSVVQVVPIHTVWGHTVLGDRSRLELNPKHPALEALRAAFQEP